LAAQDKPGHDGIGHAGSGEVVVDPRLAAWIGLLVVVQNIFTSLRNSHLFDFDEGWLYVLGVGIAGGMMLGGKEIASRALRRPARGRCASPGCRCETGATFTSDEGRVLSSATTMIEETPQMSASGVKQTVLVCHGAWGGGWSWKKMHPLMREAGYRLLTPSYTGLGERAHLANPSVDLETHIQDILNVITYEDLRDIVLLGHSYGGMVATGVADRAGDKIAQLIYLDAFVPGDGQCLLDFVGESERQRMRGLVKSGDGWRVPPNPTPPDTPEADLDWLAARRVDMPIKCFETKLRLENRERMPPRSYIYCTRTAPADPFGQFAGRAKNERAGAISRSTPATRLVSPRRTR
jgi:pimeloyl-ACP methyl ester carboxylesterase